jgi:hypothetical protein
MPCRGKFPGKEGGKQVLAGLAPSSQTIAYLLRVPSRTIYPKVPVKIIPKSTSKNSFNFKLFCYLLVLKIDEVTVGMIEFF